MARPFHIHRGNVGSISQKTSKEGHAHKTRCFVNNDHKHTTTLMGLSPHQIQVCFDRAMAMVGRRDHSPMLR